MKNFIFCLSALAFLAFSNCKKLRLQKVSDCMEAKFDAFKMEDRAKQIMAFEDSEGKKFYWLRDDSREGDGCEIVLNEDCEQSCLICGDPIEPPTGACAQPESKWTSIWKK